MVGYFDSQSGIIRDLLWEMKMWKRNRGVIFAQGFNLRESQTVSSRL